MLNRLNTQLTDRQDLTPAQVQEAVAALMNEAVPVAEKAEFLIALALKGETIGEIAAFARELRLRAIQPPIPDKLRSLEILDVCGTGGDHLKTFNISTTVALVVAAAGVPVAKHGNRAITSSSGSADVLEALGIRIDLTPDETAQMLAEHNFAFFFAPKYHPAFKNIGPARKLCAERGQRTIFNFLGPLLNPALPSAQLVGVPQPSLCERLARVLQSLGTRRGMVVSGTVAPESYLDELSTLGDSTVAEFYHDRGFAVTTLSVRDLPIQPATLVDLQGGDSRANAEIIRQILDGKDRGPKRDAVILNSAAALLVAGKAKSIAQGWDVATEIIESGRATKKLTELAQARL